MGVSDDVLTTAMAKDLLKLLERDKPKARVENPIPWIWTVLPQSWTPQRVRMLEWENALGVRFNAHRRAYGMPELYDAPAYAPSLIKKKRAKNHDTTRKRIHAHLRAQHPQQKTHARRTRTLSRSIPPRLARRKGRVT